MEGPNRLSRVARMRQRAQARKRARARRAALAAGAAGLLVIAVMLGVAFSRPSPAKAVAADRADAPPSLAAPSSSPSTSFSAQAAAAAAAPQVAGVSSADVTGAPGSVTPEPTAATTSTATMLSAAAGPGSTVDSSTQPSSSPSGKPFGGTAVAGVLYRPESGVSSHFCSASVVHSPAGNLVITAAHCVYSDGPKSDIAFAPGFHNGRLPYGSWTVTKVVVSQNWQSSNDQDEDVAFLQVAPDSSGASLESVTGADQIAFNRGFGMPVTVPAYPQGSDTPITCLATAKKFSSTQTEWDCRGYPDGTSGAPFLTNVSSSGSSGEKGTVVGVIGGYQQGGDTPDISYSAYFGSAIQALYQNASS